MGSDILKQVTPWRWRPSWVSLFLSVLVLAFAIMILGTVVFVLLDSFNAQNFSWSSIAAPWLYSFRVACFTCLICGIAAPVLAWSLWYLKIKTHLFEQLLALPYCLPTVAVGGMIVLLYGNAGLLNHLLVDQLNISSDPVSFLYQDASPLLGTVWMNLSLGVLLILRQWNSIPVNQWRQAELMHFTEMMKARYVILPAIQTSLVPWLGLVFLACFNSFGLMLMLSGSPSATTIELATWQTLFMEGDWSKAGILMIVQLASSIFFIAIFWRWMRRSSNPFEGNQTSSAAKFEHTAKSRPMRVLARIFISLFALFYTLPVIALSLDVFHYLMDHSTAHFDDLLRASIVSTKNALATGMIAAIVAIVTVPTLQKSFGFRQYCSFRWISFVTWLPAMIPGMVCAFAILVWSSFADLAALKGPAIWLIQSFLALPIAIAVYRAGWISHLSAHFRIKEELALSSWAEWRDVEFPAMWKWAATAGVIASGLSLSDVTVVSFLAETDDPPLTTLIARLMGSYQFGEASIIILILVLLTAALFFVSTYRFKGVIRDRMP